MEFITLCLQNEETKIKSMLSLALDVKEDTLWHGFACAAENHLFSTCQLIYDHLAPICCPESIVNGLHWGITMACKKKVESRENMALLLSFFKLWFAISNSSPLLTCSPGPNTGTANEISSSRSSTTTTTTSGTTSCNTAERSSSILHLFRQCVRYTNYEFARLILEIDIKTAPTTSMQSLLLEILKFNLTFVEKIQSLKILCLIYGYQKINLCLQKLKAKNLETMVSTQSLALPNQLQSWSSYRKITSLPIELQHMLLAM